MQHYYYMARSQPFGKVNLIKLNLMNLKKMLTDRICLPFYSTYGL